MDSPRIDEHLKRPNAPPPEIEFVNNHGPYPPLSQTPAIPPVSVSGTAYPSYQPIQSPSSPYFSGYNRQHPPAAYSMASCPYPIEISNNTPYSCTKTTTTTSNRPPPGVPQNSNQLPYPPPQDFGDPTLPPYVSSSCPYPPQYAHSPKQNPPYPSPMLQHYSPVAPPYPIQIPALVCSPTQQTIGLVAPPIGMNLEQLAAADLLHHQGAPSKRIELGNPTVIPVKNFEPQVDAKKLHDAFQQESPNKDILISILCHRSLEQRLVIAEKYFELTGCTLIGQINSNFEFNFEKLMVALITPRIDYYVQEFYEALDNYDFDSIIDIMCPLSNYEMYKLKYEYEKKYGISVEEQLDSKTSGHLKRLLLKICDCRRDESGITNLAAAQYDAMQLSRQDDPYTNENNVFYAELFSERNFQQIKLISEEFHKLTKESLEKHIKNKFIIDDKQGFLCIIRYSENKLSFFAKRLHRSMEGIGTNDSQLIRLIVTRCEIDLQDIKERFRKNFGKTLRSWIKGDTSGHYKYSLYELIGEKRSN